MRGSSSHGGGHKKKRRGSGHRGGFGLSGSGARGDQKKPSVLKGSTSFFKLLAAQKGTPMKELMKKYAHQGKRGFHSIHKKKMNTLSLTFIEQNFDKMIELGIITKEKDVYTFDAKASGYDKILGKGSFTKKITIICDEISQSAKQKVEDAKGKVILPQKENEFEESKDSEK